ncbi:mCG1036929, isoform CRA_c, partial [Mus musculus]
AHLFFLFTRWILGPINECWGSFLRAKLGPSSTFPALRIPTMTPRFSPTACPSAVSIFRSFWNLLRSLYRPSPGQSL